MHRLLLSLPVLLSLVACSDPKPTEPKDDTTATAATAEPTPSLRLPGTVSPELVKTWTLKDQKLGLEPATAEEKTKMAELKAQMKKVHRLELLADGRFRSTMPGMTGEGQEVKEGKWRLAEDRKWMYFVYEYADYLDSVEVVAASPDKLVLRFGQDKESDERSYVPGPVQ